jgi:uncharacterized protein YndB with AHSA1/START domain
VHIEARAQVQIAAPPDTVFDVGADYRSFARFMHGYGPIPGITSARMHGDAAPAAGARRDIHMSDGSTVEEVILAFDRPSQHRYRWVRPPAPPFSLVVRVAEGEWLFEPAQGGRETRLIWTYGFELTSALAYPAALILRAVFARWMRQNLERLRTLIEASG